MLTRRQFVLSTVAGGAALTGLPITARANVRGANDAIRVGFIGLRQRGATNVNWFRDVPGVRIAALCDPDRNILAREKNKCDERGESVATYTDLRALLDNKDIDVVVLAMPVHWHALAGIYACQAGKDVYVEKPVCHNLWEGRKLIEAARKYNRIVQGGTQQRSDADVVDAVRQYLMEEKQLGKLLWVRAQRYGVREGMGRVDGPQSPPDHVDYNLWAGPGPAGPIMRSSFHYDWHFQWDYGAGETANWGVHILDDVRNIGKFDGLPHRCFAAGGRLLWDDDGQTPNVHLACFDTRSAPVYFDLSNLPQAADDSSARQYRGVRSGSVFQCEGGYYVGGRAGGWAYDNSGNRIKQFRGDGGRAHAANFIEAVRSRNAASLNGGIEEIYYSSAWCHLANISYRLGRTYDGDEALQRAGSTTAWSQLLHQVHEHLAAHDLQPGDLQLGAMLELDRERETFRGPTATSEALALLRREYRKPFVVPEEV